jgi:hypothetical protein
MQTRDFERKLKLLNPKLHIYYGVDDSKSAGVWYDAPGWNGSEVEELCGVPKENIPEWSEMSPTGKMLKGGWNRVLVLLVSNKIIDRHASYKYFGYWDEHRFPGFIVEASKLDKAIKDIEENRTGMKRIENPLCPGEMIDVKTYKKDDIVDMGNLVRENI